MKFTGMRRMFCTWISLFIFTIMMAPVWSYAFNYQFSVDSPTVTEGDSGIKNLTFTISLTPAVAAGLDDEVRVTYQTVDGSSVAGSDYGAVSDTLTFVDGTGTTLTVDVPITGDELVESDEDFTFELYDATVVTSTDGNTVTVDPPDGTGTIKNDDIPTFTVNDSTVDEGDSGTTATGFQVTTDLAIAKNTSASFTYTVQHGTTTGADFSGTTSDTLTLSDVGANSTVGLPFSIVGDTVVERDETYTINLSNGTIAGSAGIPDTTDSGTGLIRNDDSPELSIQASSSDAEGDSGQTTVNYTVTSSLPVADDAAVTFDYAISDTSSGLGNDLNNGSSTLSITDGSTVNVAVQLTGDQVVEGDESYTVTISNAQVPSSSLGASIDSAADTGAGVIINDDIPTLTVNNQIIVEGDTGSTSADFTVTSNLAVAADTTVSFDWSVSNGTTVNADFASTLSGGPLSFTDVGAGATVNIPLTLATDTIVEPDETFTIPLSNGAITGTTDKPVLTTGTGTIENDDIPTLTVNDSTLGEGDSGTTATGLQVTTDLAIAENTSVSFTYTVQHGTTTGADFSGTTSDTLTLSDVGANSTVALPLNVVGDTVVERDETYTINLSNGTIAGSAGIPDTTDTGTGLIRNDDSPELSIQASSSDEEGNSGQTTVNYTVTSTLQVADDAAVTFDAVISDTTSALGNDLNNGSSTLSITDGSTVNVAVQLTGDQVVEGDESYTVTISNANVPASSVGASINSAADTGNGIIENDDIPTLTVNDSSVYEGLTGSTDPGFAVTTDLAVAADTTVSFDWAVSNGTTDNADFATGPPVSGSLVFTGVPGGSSVVVPLAIASDNVDEPDETYTLILSNGDITNTTTAPDVSDTGAGEIKNDDHTFVITKTVEPAKGTLSGGGHSADDTFIVARGSDITFTMTATDSCYHIKDFQVDGTSTGDLASYTNQPPADYNDYTSDSYTFTSVVASHTVNLDMAINTYTVETKQYGTNGSISATGEYNCGDTPTITATAATGYHITWFKVNGVKQSAANGQTSFDYTISGGVSQDYLIEVAFTVKATLTHESPFGTTEVTVYNSDPDSGISDGTVLLPDENGVVYVDYGAVLRVETVGESHTVQGPDYIASPTEQLDNRNHVHHLSKITDNSTVVLALCGAGFIDPNYRSDPDCRYTIAPMMEDHELEVLFTGFVDVSAHGYGDILSPPELNVNGTAGGFAVGSLEFEAGENRTLTFDPAGGWFVQSLQYKITPEDKTDETGLVSLSRSLSFAVPQDLDRDHGIQVNFSINSFTIQATSTFEELLFHDLAMTDRIAVENDNTDFQADYNTDKSYYVLINDPDFSVVGLAIDSTFVPIKTIRNYVAGTETNPESDAFIFGISTISGNEILELTFKNVKVSHHLEVRDYDNVIIADVPLDAQANPNPPALMFVTDDSGSMDWEFMVQGAAGGRYNGNMEYIWSTTVVPDSVRAYGHTESNGDNLFDNNRYDEWESQWSGHNRMYYNPAVTFTPWPDFKGTVADWYDLDGDGNTSEEIGSQLPSTDVTGDNLAHANIYRPRHHPALNVDCTEALALAVKRRTEGTPRTMAEITAVRTVCNNTQTFDMDGEFISLSGGASNVELQDSQDTSRTGNWTPYGNDKCNEGDYRYNDGNGTAIYSYTPTATASHTLEVSWRSYNTRSTSVPYHIQCAICSPSIDVTYNVNQQQDGYYDDGMITLDSNLAFEAGKPITVTIGPAPGGSQSIDAIRLTWTSATLDAIINAHYYTFDDVNNDEQRDANEDIWLVNLTDPITYSRVKDPALDISAANLDAPLLGTDPALPSTLVTYADPTDPDAFVIERQNFADWYSGYRTRQRAATAAQALAIERMSNVEVGIQTINHTDYWSNSKNRYISTYGISQSALPVRVWGKRDKSKYLLYLLYSFRQGPYGTPLVQGHRDVARYFDATDGLDGEVRDSMLQSGLTKSAYTCGDGAEPGDSDDFLSPFAKDPGDSCQEKNGDRCKVAIAVLLTDGYWNSNTTGGEIALPDDYDHLRATYASTLAGYAYDYRFMKDLMDDDDGDQQYMITYGVAFGLSGSLPYDENYVCTVLDDTDCPAVWPKPSSGSNTTIDDLWHASVNGEGRYLNADSPAALVKALGSIVSDIEGKQGSSVSLAVNGDELYESINDEIRLYQASWSTGDSNASPPRPPWTGDLASYDPTSCTVNADGTLNLDSCKKWSAYDLLAARTTPRVIATNNPWKANFSAPFTAGGGVPFRFGSLDPTQQARLFPYFAHDVDDPTDFSDVPAQHVVNLLRGDQTLHSDVIAKLRDVPALGDVVNSQGRFQRYGIDDADGNSPGDAGWNPTYTGVIYIGANDGMLHAFSAEDMDKGGGQELFAYVPSQVYRNLRELADPDYKDSNHKMFVDATPYTKTITLADGSEKTILVGGLGKGGKGYYALDVTTPFLNTEANAGDWVLWEYPPVPDKLVVNRTVTFTANRILFGSNPLTAGEIADFYKYTHFEIVGANNVSGTLSTTNDGFYAIDDADGDGILDGVALDGSYIQIPKADFDTMSNVSVTILGSTSDPDMGYSFSKPIIVETNDSNIGANGWVVIFGNGYGSERGDSVLYILNPLTGEEIDIAGTKIGKIYTTPLGVHGGGFSGMSTPKVIDVNNDLKVDYVYAGDLQGNMWKFDLTAGSPAAIANDPTADQADDWQVAFCDGSANKDKSDCSRTDSNVIPQPLFKTNLKQPITSAPDIMRHESGKGYMVIFGTGKYLGWLDLITTDTQSLYGIWDWAPDAFDQGYHGARSDTVYIDTSVTPNVTHNYVRLTNYPQNDGLGAPLHTLLQQYIVAEGYLSEDVDNDGILDPSEDINNNGVLDPGEDLDGDGALDLGEDIDGDGVIDEFSYFRIPTAYEGDWRTVSNDQLGTVAYPDYVQLNGPADMQVPLTHLGWVFDLPGRLTKGTGRDLNHVDTGRTYNVDPTLEHTAENYELGERQVNDTIIRDGKAIMITFGIGKDKCGASAYSFLNERNVNSGGMLFKPNYDVNQDGILNWEDVVTINPEGGASYAGIATDGMYEGRLFNPVILRDPPPPKGKPTEQKFMSGSVLGQGLSGAKIEKTSESAERIGVYYWQQVE